MTNMNTNIQAIIVGAGKGTRFGATPPKQFIELGNMSISQRTIDLFLSFAAQLHVFFVIPPEYFDQAATLFPSLWQNKRLTFVSGGQTRFHSVQNAVRLLAEGSIVFVHDAVRCLCSAALLSRCYNTAIQKGNAVPAIPMSQSVRRVTATRSEAVDRNNLYVAQTPQTFRSELLIRGFAQPHQPHFTDEASVIDTLGEMIHLVEGEPQNIKITYPHDLLYAQALLHSR